jgi:hypothetical protein
MLIAVTELYIYIVLRHFADQKWKALSAWNYIGHGIILIFKIGSIAAVLVIFSDKIFTLDNLEVFIPRFVYTYDMWLTITVNIISLIWMIVLSMI